MLLSFSCVLTNPRYSRERERVLLLSYSRFRRYDLEVVETLVSRLQLRVLGSNPGHGHGCL